MYLWVGFLDFDERVIPLRWVELVDAAVLPKSKTDKGTLSVIEKPRNSKLPCECKEQYYVVFL
jgi:hypothetical protein